MMRAMTPLAASVGVSLVLALASGSAAGQAPALRLEGAGVRAGSFRVADLEAMKPVEVSWTGAKGARPVLGVPLDKLLERQGLVAGKMGDDGSEHGRGWRRVVIASAPDGFQAVFTVAELTAHMGNTRALVAWKIDGKPLPSDRGPLRLVVLTDKIASRSVHSLSRLEVVELGKPSPPGHGHPPGKASAVPAPPANGSAPHAAPPAHGSAAAHAAPPAHGSAAAHAAPPAHGSAPHGAPPAATDGLAQVSAIHGAAGPFAVAGYRMGQRAMRELGVTSGSFDLEVRHQSPAEVQWTCIADGAQAATGASSGKLNLSLERAAREKTRTIFRRKSTGKAVAFTLEPTFVKRFLDLPRDQLERAGGEVMALPDDRIFDVD